MKNLAEVAKRLVVIPFIIAFVAVIANGQDVAQAVSSKASKYDKMLLGKHLFSLQWVSWDYFGDALITKTRQQNVYNVKAEQQDKNNGNFVSMDGVIEVVNAKHLKFKGEIITKVDHINKGKECKRSGNFDFKVKGKRKYWRLQQMDSPCSEVVDYIDIFYALKK